MAENLEGFFKNFRKYFREKKTIRWLLFTYPKSVATSSLAIALSFVYFILVKTKESQLKVSANTNALHANDNVSIRSPHMLIYGKNNNSK